MENFKKQLQEKGLGFGWYNGQFIDATIHQHIYTKDRNSTRKYICSCGDSYTPAT